MSQRPLGWVHPIKGNGPKQAAREGRAVHYLAKTHGRGVANRELGVLGKPGLPSFKQPRLTRPVGDRRPGEGGAEFAFECYWEEYKAWRLGPSYMREAVPSPAHSADLTRVTCVRCWKYVADLAWERLGDGKALSEPDPPKFKLKPWQQGPDVCIQCGVGLRAEAGYSKAITGCPTHGVRFSRVRPTLADM